MYLLIHAYIGVYFARKLVLSVGAWAPQLYGQNDALRALVPLHIERRVLFWFHPTHNDAKTRDDFKVCPYIFLFTCICMYIDE